MGSDPVKTALFTGSQQFHTLWKRCEKHVKKHVKLNSSHVFSQFNSQVFHSIFTCFYPIVIIFHSTSCSTIFFLISDYEINYTKLFYSNLWTVSHLLIFVEKDSPLHPRLNKFPSWIHCKATYKAKGAASMHHCGFWFDV